MLQSMTGYGRSEFTVGDYTCSLEIRSLNGKQFEVTAKIPPIVKLFEIELRNIIQQKLSRGTIDVNIYLKQHGISKPMTVNMDLAKYYYASMQQIATELQIEQKDILPTLMRMPEIVSGVTDTLSDEDWQVIAAQIGMVCDMLTQHRQKEGVMLTRHIENNILRIDELCRSVEVFDKKRLDRIRERLQQSLSDLTQSANMDPNRLEQEMIFYVEKLDIQEEKNRLLHHCEYFLQLIKEDASTKGKKLGFLIQEIGREINTMGSKANDVDIQRIVVQMKDELEQAKEQLLNAL